MTSIACAPRRARVAIPISPARGRWVWKAVQLAGVAATVALIAGLVLRPEPSLHILWDMVIPLLPAVFLINPMIWRNVCPVGTLNAFAGRRARRRRRSEAGLRTAWAAGIVLLFLLVPARHVIFNESGTSLALLISVLAVTAIATGTVYDRRAGFCSALCPVLPVEKLYGQAPLVQIGSAHCSDCSLCVSAGCPDLARGRAAAQSVGARWRWMATPYGAFAAAFPGVIAGYFTFGPEWRYPYLYIAAGAMVSWMLVVAAALRLERRICLPILGALSFAMYYWWSGPKLADAYGIVAAGLPLQIAAIIVAAAWLWRALKRQAVPV